METLEEFNKVILRDNTLNLVIEYANEFKYYVNILLNNKQVAQFDMNGEKPNLRLLHNNEIFHISSKRDFDFDKKWKEKVEHLVIKQKNKCKYCKLEFVDTKKILHHNKTEEKIKGIDTLAEELTNKILAKQITLEQGIKKYNWTIEEYIQYYKSLKDTDLICYKCHYEIHKFNVS